MGINDPIQERLASLGQAPAPTDAERLRAYTPEPGRLPRVGGAHMGPESIERLRGFRPDRTLPERAPAGQGGPATPPPEAIPDTPAIPAPEGQARLPYRLAQVRVDPMEGRNPAELRNFTPDRSGVPSPAPEAPPPRPSLAPAEGQPRQAYRLGQVRVDPMESPNAGALRDFTPDKTIPQRAPANATAARAAALPAVENTAADAAKLRAFTPDRSGLPPRPLPNAPAAADSLGRVEPTLGEPYQAPGTAPAAERFPPRFPSEKVDPSVRPAAPAPTGTQVAPFDPVQGQAPNPPKTPLVRIGGAQNTRWVSWGDGGPAAGPGMAPGANPAGAAPGASAPGASEPGPQRGTKYAGDFAADDLKQRAAQARAMDPTKGAPAAEAPPAGEAGKAAGAATEAGKAAKPPKAPLLSKLPPWVGKGARLAGKASAYVAPAVGAWEGLTSSPQEIKEFADNVGLDGSTRGGQLAGRVLRGLQATGNAATLGLASELGESIAEGQNNPRYAPVNRIPVVGGVLATGLAAGDRLRAWWNAPADGLAPAPAQASQPAPAAAPATPAAAPADDTPPEGSGITYASPKRPNSPDTNAMVQRFLADYGPLAQRVADRTGVHPEAVLAQWALETGYGAHVIPGSNNPGNIKSRTGQGVLATDNQTGSRDAYSAFDSREAGADGFADFLLNNKRYAEALKAGGTPEGYLSAMGRSGYAEDPHYGRKLLSTLQTIRNASGGAAVAVSANPADYSPGQGAAYGGPSYLTSLAGARANAQALAPVQEALAQNPVKRVWYGDQEGAAVVEYKDGRTARYFPGTAGYSTQPGATNEALPPEVEEFNRLTAEADRYDRRQPVQIIRGSGQVEYAVPGKPGEAYQNVPAEVYESGRTGEWRRAQVQGALDAANPVDAKVRLEQAARKDQDPLKKITAEELERQLNAAKTPEEREEVFRVLTGKDKWIKSATEMGTDAFGNPIIKDVSYNSITGQPIGQGVKPNPLKGKSPEQQRMLRDQIRQLVEGKKTKELGQLAEQLGIDPYAFAREYDKSIQKKADGGLVGIDASNKERRTALDNRLASMGGVKGIAKFWQNELGEDDADLAMNRTAQTVADEARSLNANNPDFLAGDKAAARALDKYKLGGFKDGGQIGKKKAAYADGGVIPGLVEPGNIDLNARPVVKTPDGGFATVRSMGINDGRHEVLIPTVSDDGRLLDPKEAVALYRQTGRHLGKFTTQADSDAYAEQLHQAQAQQYAPKAQAAGYARGGMIPGHGTGESDSVKAAVKETGEPVALSRGEYRLPPEAVKKIGADRLDALVARYHHQAPLPVEAGSYIIPADVVKALGRDYFDRLATAE